MKVTVEIYCPKRRPRLNKLLHIVLVLLLSNIHAHRASAQARIQLTGFVFSAEDKKPLPGAVITNGNSSSRTATSLDGKFQLSTSDTAGILKISFIGYQTEYINFSPREHSTFYIYLHANATQLNEVVVSTGYQTLPKERATGSFVQVDSSLVNRRVSTDILSRLEGVVPGLLFNRNTNASSTGISDISIRGHSTLFSNDQPLVILDNFPYDGNLNNINPNDVASITLLKDAAAASIWGVRSGNGVIVITTKKGQVNQKPNVEFNSNLTLGEKPDLFYDPNFLNSSDYIDVEQQLFNAGYYTSALNTGYQVVSPVVQLLADQKAGRISADAATSQINALRSLDVRKQLQQYFYRYSANQQYNLNFRGGGLKSDYYLSLGYDHNRSNQVGNVNSRITINSNYNFYPFKNFTLSAGLYYTKTNAQNNSTVADIDRVNSKGGIYPYAQIADANGNPLAVVHDFSQSFINSAANTRFLDWNYRPLDELRNADNRSKSFDNRINLGLNYKFLKGFSADVKYVYENTQSATNNYFSQNTYYARDLINRFTQTASNGTLSYPVPMGGVLQQAEGSLASHHVRGQLNFSRDFNTDNSFTAILGSEWSSATNKLNDPSPAYGYDNSTGASYGQINYQTYYTLNPARLGSLQIPNGQLYTGTTDHFISYFTNAAYTYGNKYTLSASARIDHSNLFGVNTNQKAVPLYSVGLSWNLAKESFYKIDWLPVAKLRATYGYNGNINKSATAVTTIQQQINSYYSGTPYSIIANPGNPDLQWEKNRIINFGFDFAIKNNIISGSAELYFKKGLNLFGSSSIAPSTGYTTFFGNTADTKGHGVDITINTRNISTNRFQWLTTFLYSYAIDKVTRYGVQSTATSYLSNGDGNSGTIVPLVGAPLFGIYGFRSGPLTHDTGDPQGYLNGNLSTNYAQIVQNTTFSDLKFFGSSRPTSFGSLRNTVSYQDISLSLNIIYKLGYYFRRSSIQYSGLYSSWLGHADYTKRWQKPGDEATTNVPSIQLPNTDANRERFYTYSESLVDNGNHVRLQDITLSYDLSRHVWKNSPFTNLSIYGYINNVGILWRANHDGLDPDVWSSPAGGTTSLPLPRTYSIGLKANLK